MLYFWTHLHMNHIHPFSIQHKWRCSEYAQYIQHFGTLTRRWCCWSLEPLLLAGHLEEDHLKYKSIFITPINHDFSIYAYTFIQSSPSSNEGCSANERFVSIRNANRNNIWLEFNRLKESQQRQIILKGTSIELWMGYDDVHSTFLVTVGFFFLGKIVFA